MSRLPRAIDESRIRQAVSRIDRRSAGGRWNIGVIAESMTASVGDLIVVTDATYEVTLPVAARDNKGRSVGVKAQGVTVTVNTQADQLIDDVAGPTTVASTTTIFVSDGGGWRAI